MKRRMSLLRPDVHTVILQNEVAEKVKYLNVPAGVDDKTLRTDINLGAKQFSEIDAFLKKESDSQYILITTDNLEQGYMAVGYMAACFNKRNGVLSAEYWQDEQNSADDQAEEWEENELQIPIIEDCELRNSTLCGDSSFYYGGLGMQAEQCGCNHTPYWMKCKQEAVCIVVDSSYISLQMWDEILGFFRTNKKVYIIVVEYAYSFDWEDENRDFVAENQEMWLSLILSYTMDEVSVMLKKEDEKKYYTKLLQNVLAENNVGVMKGFSYAKIVNAIIAMRNSTKCQMIHNIVQYAIKGRCKGEAITLSEKNFAFLKRFLGTETGMCREEGKKGAMERMMHELVGMEEVKKQVLNIVHVMKYNKMRKEMNFGESAYHNVHLMLGAPGTAKTSVAKWMGQIMVEEKLLPGDRFICVNGAELKGKYVGHSAPKTKALFEAYDIIVIDEAYSLVSAGGNGDSFEREALAQLIIELENHSTDKLVVLAGYGGKRMGEKDNLMQEFLNANPGIKSRITSTIYFDSYNEEEMTRIFFKIAENRQYRVTPEAEKIVAEFFAWRVRDENFGNGREARRLLETAVVCAASRLFETKRKQYSKAEMQEITYGDVENAVRQLEKSELLSVSNATGKSVGFYVA